MEPGPASKPPRARLLLWGTATMLLYLTVAWASVEAGLVSRSPLYDGLGDLPPYRWVDPPEERLENNEVPEPEERQVQVAPSGQADPGSVSTGDAQITLTFNYLPPATAPYSFTISMTPQDPAEIAPPPAGFYFDGNAYQLEALNDATGAAIEGEFTAIMRFSVHAPHILELRDGEWTLLPDPLMTDADLQVSADASANGTYVTAGTGVRPPETFGGFNPFDWALTIVGLLGFALLLGAVIPALRRRNVSSG